MTAAAFDANVDIVSVLAAFLAVLAADPPPD
jgi:divalent metal cation (Fe/Co/Zn/Cd) transporter